MGLVTEHPQTPTCTIHFNPQFSWNPARPRKPCYRRTRGRLYELPASLCPLFLKGHKTSLHRTASCRKQFHFFFCFCLLFLLQFFLSFIWHKQLTDQFLSKLLCTGSTSWPCVWSKLKRFDSDYEAGYEPGKAIHAKASVKDKPFISTSTPPQLTLKNRAGNV